MGFQKLSLKGRALRLLAQREHSRSELEAKLARHVQEGDNLAAVLDELAAKDFINPQRVLDSVVYRRAPCLGTQRVLHELRRKGLDEELVRAAGQQLAASEHARASAVWRQRFGDAPAPQTPQERARQMRFLATRGFSAEVVRKVVRAGAGGAGDEGEDESHAL